MVETTRTTDSGMTVLERTGAAFVETLEHDCKGTLIIGLRIIDDQTGFVDEVVHYAEIEDVDVSVQAHNAFASGRRLNFRLEWWNFTFEQDSFETVTLVSCSTDYLAEAHEKTEEDHYA